MSAQTAKLGVIVSGPAAVDRTNWLLQIREWPSGNLVDIPQTDVTWNVERLVNGGSGQGTFTFSRPFNNIGALGYSYSFMLWFWPAGTAMPTDPYWAGWQADPDQVQLTQSGQVVVHALGDFSLLDDAIVSVEINPGVVTAIGSNPQLDAADFLRTLITTEQPAGWLAPSIPATMFNLQPVQFTHQKLGSVIDTIVKQGRDTSGALYTWVVKTNAAGQKQVVVQADQNPNVLPGVTFRHLFVPEQVGQYRIQTKYSEIVNVLAVYGGTDPITGVQVYGVYEDGDSVAETGRTIEDAINVPALQSNDAAAAYADVFFDLHAYPTAQGSARVLQPDPTVDAGVWLQFWEAPATASDAASVKQVRCGQVQLTLAKNNRMDQVVSTDSPVPYLDEAVYRMGQHVQLQSTIRAAAQTINRQSLFIRAGGEITATASSPAQVAANACEAVFPSGVVYLPELALTTLTDNSGGANNGQTGDGNYTVSVTSAGAWIITKGHRPANTSTQQNVLAVWVNAGEPFVTDIRVLAGQPAFSSLLSAPTLKAGTTPDLATPPNSGSSGAYDQPVDFYLDPATWTNGDPAFAYLEIGAVPHGSAAQISTYTKLQPTSDGHYQGTIPAMGAGTAYDVYVRAHDNLDRPTPWLLLGETLQNTQQITTAQMPKMPAGASFTATNVSLAIGDAAMHNMMSPPAASAALFIPVLDAIFTLNESTDPDTSQWAASGNLYVRAYSTVLSQTDASTYDKHNQGALAGYFTNGKVCTFATRSGITPGQKYDVAVSLLDAQGGETALVYLGNVTCPQVQSGDPVGPIWGKQHHLPIATDPTNGTWDGANDAFAYDVHHPAFRGVVNDDGSAAQTADWLPESASRKWAAESGANITETRFAAGTGSGASQRSAAAMAGALSSSAGTDGSYINSSQIARRHLYLATNQGGGNLIYNPRGENNLSGWGTYNITGTGISWSQAQYFNGCIHAYYAGGAAQAALLQEQVGVVGGTVEGGETYTFSALIQCNNGRGYLQLQAIPSNNSAGSNIVAGNGLASASVNLAPGDTSVMVKLVADNNSGAGAIDVYFIEPQFEMGSISTDYGDDYHGRLIPRVLNSNAQATASTFMNPQGSMGVVGGVPSSLPYSSTSSSITLNLPAVTLKRADQSTVPIPAASLQFTGLNPSTTYYFLVGIDANALTWGASYASAAFSGTQQVTNGVGFGGDGHIPIFNNSTAATAASGQTGGGSGGYSGPQNQCPAAWQLVLTKERGFIQADAVEIGMHLPCIGGWTQVLEAVKLPAPIWRYTLERHGVREAFDVNDTHAIKRTDGEWAVVRDLRGGEQVIGGDGPLTVIDAAYLKDDYYIAFTVQGHEYLLGGALCHNVTTF